MNFASDNTSCASDKIMQALVKANAAPAMPYGNDDWTARIEDQLKDVFECDLKAFPVATGSAANALALSCMTPSYGSVYCHKFSHINVDECGSPELHTDGAKLVPLEGESAKINPDELRHMLKISGKGDVHHVQPAALSITQLTEMGTAYTKSEIEVLCEIAKGYDMKVHMDGARFANALLGQRLTPAEMTWQSGVDVLSFGASKNGAFAAEAVVFFDLDLAKEFDFRRKRGGHLFSKMRFISAQLEAYLDDDHWLDNARLANAAASALIDGLAKSDTPLMYEPAGNMLFPCLKQKTVETLQAAGGVFYPWVWEDSKYDNRSAFRLVTPFNTDAEDTNRFLDLVATNA